MNNDINYTASSPLLHSCLTDVQEVKKLIQDIEVLEEELKNMSRDKAWHHYGQKVPLKESSLNCILFALESEILNRKIKIQKLNTHVI